MDGGSEARRLESTVKAAAEQNRRSFWLKQLHQWHWISAAVSLVNAGRPAMLPSSTASPMRTSSCLMTRPAPIFRCPTSEFRATSGNRIVSKVYTLRKQNDS